MRQDACVENMATLNCHTSEVAESIVELSWGAGVFCCVPVDVCCSCLVANRGVFSALVFVRDAP